MNLYLQKLRAISENAPVRALPKVPKGAYGSFGSARTTRIPEIEAANDTRDLIAAQAERRPIREPDGGIDPAIAVHLARANCATCTQLSQHDTCARGHALILRQLKSSAPPTRPDRADGRGCADYAPLPLAALPVGWLSPVQQDAA